MNQIPNGWLDFLRQQFPEGSRVKLREMKNDLCPIKPGSMGTLESIDDAGTFHVQWDDGRNLGLVMGADAFSILPPPIQTLKLYMPMTATYYDEEDGLETDITMDSREAAEYAPQIIAALQKERAQMEREADSPEEAGRGLMTYYSKDDSVGEKVLSYFFTAEVRDGRLWGVAECKVQGTLTPEETQRLIDDIGGQASDGFGEGFEQREIRINNGLEIYAHLWQRDGWTIMAEQDRFDPEFPQKLPDYCWSTRPSDGSLICVQRGVSGYHMSSWSTDKPEQNRRIADYNNRERGISKIQEEAMVNGSMFGWDTPAADPRTYMRDTPQTPQMGGPSM